MKPFIAVVAVALLTIGSASAGKPGGKSSYHGGGVQISNYHLTYGKSFAGGVYFPGKYHNCWSYQCYWPKYGCNCYWCPSNSCYYYWYEPARCYYPISYITVATPAYVQAPLTISGPPAGVPGPPK